MTEKSCRTPGADEAGAMAAFGRACFIESYGHLYHPDDLAAFLDRHAEARWAAELADADFVVCVAEQGGQKIGYIKLAPLDLPFDPGTRRAIELRSIYVPKPWHGAGIAQALMNWAVAAARERGFEDMYLAVFIHSHRARRFYERCGFVEVGNYAFQVGNHVDDDRIMRLTLS